MVTQADSSRWKKLRTVIKVVEWRRRVVAVLAATGLAFAYWDTLANRYDKWMRPTSAHVEAAHPGTEFYCPMHPNVVRDESGTCPVCGMPLSKRVKGEKAPLPEGVLARVQLGPMRVRQGNIRTVSVAYEPMLESLTTVGTVEYDERRLKRISSKVKGMARVEKLYVDFNGVEVEAGQPMAELYGPELYQGVRELLLAQKRSQSTTARSIGGDPSEMVSLSVDKLKLMGVTQSQVDAILKSGKAEFTLPIVAPIGGHVVRKEVVEGQYVTEGQMMFEVVDLHHVWVKAQVHEDQVGLVRVGQEVEATVGAYPGEVFKGKVAFLQPHLDPTTRTMEVRYDLMNTGHKLRPGFFATVTLKTPVAETPMFRGHIASSRARIKANPTVAEQENCPVTGGALGSMGDPIAAETGGRKVWTCCGACPPKLKATPAKYLARLEPPPVDGVLSVPESAVIDTGTLTMVYVEAEAGVFEGRKVVLGPRSGNRFPVLEGLASGEAVVANGAFLVDAESRLDPSTRPEELIKEPEPGPGGRLGSGLIHRSSFDRTDTVLLVTNSDRNGYFVPAPLAGEGLGGGRVAPSAMPETGVSRRHGWCDVPPPRPSPARGEGGRIMHIIFIAGTRLRDRRHHRVVDPQPVPRDPGRPGGRGGGDSRAHVDAGRRDPGPLREPGDRVHRLDGAEPAGDRGPGDVSALGELAGARRGEGGPVVERVQLLDDHDHLHR